MPSPLSVSPVPATPHPATADLARLRSFAKLFDSQFRLPGTQFRFGLDPILGLIPVAGDAASLLMSAGLIMTIARHGASSAVVFRMFGNLLLDAIIGSIPVLGSIFDFVYKANDKNLRLLERHYQEGRHQGRGTGILLLTGLALVLLLGLITYGAYRFFRWAWESAESYF
jgi:hypothetical protein